MGRLIIKNGKVITPFKELDDTAIVIKDGKIDQFIRSRSVKNETGVIDAKGMFVVPGFIEIHRHGLGKWDVLGESGGDIQGMAQALLEEGTTAFLPTIRTAPLSRMRKCADVIRKAMTNGISKSPKAEILGVHLEGPYLCPNRFFQREGLTDIKKYIRKPSIKDFEKNFGEFQDIIKMVTLAPETDGAMSLIRHLSEKGIVCAAGHSDASFKEIQRAAEKGLKHITHIFNGMPLLHHREPGIVGAALQNDSFTIDLIADKIHIGGPVMEILFRLKKKDKVILITDGIKKFAFPDGHKQLLGGSLVKMNECIANVVSLGISLKEAIKMATINPARLIGIEGRLGSLTIGKEANITLMDDNLGIHTVIVKGNVARRQ